MVRTMNGSLLGTFVGGDPETRSTQEMGPTGREKWIASNWVRNG